eukprot:jgi/Botrbrau1/13965/Bobra.0130s0003.2
MTRGTIEIYSWDSRDAISVAAFTGRHDSDGNSPHNLWFYTKGHFLFCETYLGVSLSKPICSKKYIIRSRSTNKCLPWWVDWSYLSRRYCWLLLVASPRKVSLTLPISFVSIVLSLILLRRRACCTLIHIVIGAAIPLIHPLAHRHLGACSTNGV